MALLDLPNFFSAGNFAKASEVNANNTALVDWANGNVQNDNIGTLTGPFNWNIVTGSEAIVITNAGAEGSIEITQNAALNPNKASIRIVDNGAQISGDAGLYINFVSLSSTIPAIRVDYKGYTNFEVKPDSISIPIRTTAERDALTAQVSGDLLYNSSKTEVEYYDGDRWEQLRVPAGVTPSWAGGTTPPDGYLLCDGSTVSRTTYAKLYAAIGDRWGEGDGATTFHLPDGRGRVLRGMDSGTGRDPDAGARTESNTGGATGDAVGSLQDEATGDPGLGATTNTTGSHQHGLTMRGNGPAVTPVFIATGDSLVFPSQLTGAAGNHSHVISISGWDNETRMKNIYVNFIIKF